MIFLKLFVDTAAHYINILSSSIDGYKLSQVEHDNKELKSFFTENKEGYIFYFDLAQEELPFKVQAYMEARTSLE